MINAMIFAAGLGTRLGSFTKDRPKALVELNGTPLLELAMEQLSNVGVDRLVVNVHHFGDQVIDFLRGHHCFGMDVCISDERNMLLDTGGGLKKAQDLFIPNAPVLIYNVDILSDMNLTTLLATHEHSGALATMAVRQRESSRYLLFDDQQQLCGWRNIKTGEVKIARSHYHKAKQFAFNGIHVVSPQIFSLIDEEGAFSIIDMYLRLAKENTIMSYNDDSLLWMDLGKPQQLAEAERVIKKRSIKRGEK